MENKMVKNVRVPVSLCDNTSRMGITGLLDLFQDMASEHGEDIRLGRSDLAEKGLIWIVAKTKIIIHERPKMLQPVTAETWPEKPGRLRCNRYYTVSGEGRLMAEAKSEWVMLEVETGRPFKTEGAYPKELTHIEDTVCNEPFFRSRDDFDQCEEIGKYTVCSSDIDASQHMNNVCHIRAILGALSCGELAEMNVREVDVSYKLQCYEGEELSIRVKRSEDAVEYGIVKPDGKTATVLRLA